MGPTFFIFMRTDIPDLNPGKLGAQAAHAQAEFSAMIENKSNDEHLFQAFIEWQENRAFGKTVVLEATLLDIEYLTDRYDNSGITYDPTYPWRNFFGEIVLSDIPTCGWAFVFENHSESDSVSFGDFTTKLKSLPLYR